MLAAAWIAKDAAWQQDVYDKTGKRPLRMALPKATEFVSEDEWRQAIAGRLFLCHEAEHEGNRMLLPDQIYSKGGRACIQCKQRKTLELAAAKREKDKKVVYDTADAWMAEHGKTSSETHPEMTIGFCKTPRPSDLASPAEYERALVMVEMHNKEYHKQYHKLKSVRDADNAQQRERYAHRKQMHHEELATKHQRAQEHKRARLEAPVTDPTKDKCSVGPHLVDKQDMFYDPVDDLGLLGYTGNRDRTLRRAVCKHHFVTEYERKRRHKDKKKEAGGKAPTSSSVHKASSGGEDAAGPASTSSSSSSSSST